MRGINSACVDLIYLDPPFNSNAKYGEIFDPKSKERKEIFKDIWNLQDIDLAWWGQIKKENGALYKYLDAVRGVHSSSMMSYLIYMAVRLIEMHRILKPTGSIYLHCDPHASHYLKPLMDTIFGHKNFKNEIIWSYQRWTGATKHFQRMHDVILFYAVGKDAKFNMLREPYSEKSKHKGARFSKFIEGELQQSYTDDTSREKAMRDVWEISYLNSQSRERKIAGNYPTIKPLALLNRILFASSDEGDMVLDPFCGCATTCVAADNYGRNWVGIDISPEAGRLVQNRITSRLFTKNFRHIDKLPKRTDKPKPKPYNHSGNLSVLYGQQAGYCFLCYKHREIEVLSVDHIIARSKGGSDYLDNLQLVCQRCNSKKGNKSYEEALAEQWRTGGAAWEKRKHEAEQEIHKMLGSGEQ